MLVSDVLNGLSNNFIDYLILVTVIIYVVSFLNISIFLQLVNLLVYLLFFVFIYYLGDYLGDALLEKLISNHRIRNGVTIIISLYIYINITNVITGIIFSKRELEYIKLNVKYRNYSSKYHALTVLHYIIATVLISSIRYCFIIVIFMMCAKYFMSMNVYGQIVDSSVILNYMDRHFLNYNNSVNIKTAVDIGLDNFYEFLNIERYYR